VQQRGARGHVAGRIGFATNAHSFGLAAARQEILLKGPVIAAAGHPDISTA